MNGEHSADPVALLFGGMEKLGPGGNDHTLHVLNLLPRRQFGLVVDAGCGTGRQTMALASTLRTPVHAVDCHQAFLDERAIRARENRIEELVKVRCMDMRDIPGTFAKIDLPWCEGAAYNIGFANALAIWRPALVPGGLAVVSELSWLKDSVPAAVSEFFQRCYPDMRSIRENARTAENAGYEVLATYTLPRESWVEGYYDILEPRANALIDHPDPSVRAFAADTLTEIRVFEHADDSYGYVFLALRRV